VRQPHWLLRQIVRGLRILLGILLIIGGLFGFLPIVGFWMLPLGVIGLAREVPAVARLLERVRRRWRRDP
jgi:hypothetical protein